MTFATLGCVKALNLWSVWENAGNTCCAYKTGCSTTKWYDRADLVCMAFGDSVSFPYNVWLVLLNSTQLTCFSTVWLVGSILLILCNLAEIGILIFGKFQLSKKKVLITKN